MALRLLLLMLMLAATLLITQAQGIGSSASDCCLKYSQQALPRTMVTSYRLQGPESGCFMHAVVFTTKRAKKICASPTDRSVQRLMKYLDKPRKKGRSQRSGGKPKQQRQQRV